jgi:membrane protein DedA with SNARE-associated domain
MRFRLAAIFAFIFSVFSTSYAQTMDNYQEFLNQTDKMIAVILVLVIILLGIALFLLFLEKRIRKLEDKNKPIE